MCSGVPHEEIVALAEAERADLVVIGTHGRGGLGRAVLGSVADRVVRLAPCPVLSVRVPA
jgi:nucleotide-binding universal stress UspA family protein